MSGFIKLYRGWHDNEVFSSSEPYCERAAWAWLLSNAAWKATNRVGPQGDLVRVGEGEFHTSLRTLGKAWNWDKNKVSRFLKRARMCGNIGTSAGQAGLHISICNWDKYQGMWDKRDTESGTSAGQARDIQKEVKNKRRKKYICFTKPFDVSDLVWNDWVVMRGAKKASISETVLSNIEKQASIAGWTTEQALAECVVRNWTGFKAEWVSEKGNRNGQTSRDGFIEAIDIARGEISSNQTGIKRIR